MRGSSHSWAIVVLGNVVNIMVYSYNKLTSTNRPWSFLIGPEMKTSYLEKCQTLFSGVLIGEGKWKDKLYNTLKVVLQKQGLAFYWS